ncbi:neutral/alkaline non-lysosomal ceramidase N-terminal domain-containing protein, partial [Klebsiella pneumoniae]
TILYSGTAASTFASDVGKLKVGAVKTDITPSTLLDMDPLGGDFKKVHDPIHMRTLFIENGRNKVAIIALDVIEVGDMTPIRKRIEQELNIPFSNIMIVATHDHSAPRVGHVSPGALAHEGTATSNTWSNWLYDQMVFALKSASDKAVPAQFGVAKGDVDVNVNRDAYAGKKWDIGYNAKGPSDKGVWVIKFDNLSGKTIAVLSNYAVHSVVSIGIKQISGDLAGSASNYVENQLGNDTVSLFTLGAVGDQNPRIFNPLQKDTSSKDAEFAWRAMDAQGAMVGNEIVRLASNIKDMTHDVKLNAQEKVITCPSQSGTDIMSNMNQKQVDNVALRLGLITLNNTALAGVSGEVVTNIGNHLAQKTPLKNTILISMANDRVGYIPDDEAYGRPIFEVKGSPFAQGCAENAIVDHLTSMMNSVINR